MIAIRSWRSLRLCTSITRGLAAITLRDYQQDAIKSCIDQIKKGKKRIGVSLATGGGKTVIFSNLIKQLRDEHINVNNHQNFRTLLLVHRRELAMQAINTINKFMPDIRTQLEMGRCNCEIENSDVIVASVQSLVRRLDKYGPKDIDLIIVDEAHHIIANSYMKILKHFNADSQETNIPVVGFSATFERADNGALSDAIDEITYHKGIMEMIDDKWLCEGKFTTVNIDVDLSKVEQTASDFNLNSLSNAMNTPAANEVILKTYLHKKETNNISSTLLFGVDKQHIKELNEMFTANGIKSRYITSDFKNEERDQILQDFRNGKIEVLMNCGILTEGTDIPNIDSILLCRPTRSRPLLVQMIGRGLRLHHTKQYCHIIDFVGASNVGVVSFPTLIGIEKYNQQLNDVVLADLQEIKKELDRREEQMKRRDIQETQQREERNQKLLENLDITLLSYDSFENFYINNNNNSGDINDVGLTANTNIADLTGLQLEYRLLTKSNYPWIKFASNAWALSLRNTHLRVYRETNKTEKETMYKLKLYREIPRYARDQSGISFFTNEIIKSKNLLAVVSKVEAIVNNISQRSTTKKDSESLIPLSSRNFTRFAAWRKYEATDKQKQYVNKILQKVYNANHESFKSLTPLVIQEYSKTLSKGEASNILFASKVAPVYPVKSILNLLQYKNNRKKSR